MEEIKGYWIYESWEETSQFDRNPTKRWNYGGDFYESLQKVYIPDSIAKDDMDSIDTYIEDNLENDILYGLDIKHKLGVE